MEHNEKFRNTDKVKVNPGMIIVMSTITALALLLIYIAGTGIHQENYAKHGDYIIRYSFTGIENYLMIDTVIIQLKTIKVLR